jgi:hypothetical protein
MLFFATEALKTAQPFAITEDLEIAHMGYGDDHQEPTTKIIRARDEILQALAQDKFYESGTHQAIKLKKPPLPPPGSVPLEAADLSPLDPDGHRLWRRDASRFGWWGEDPINGLVLPSRQSPVDQGMQFACFGCEEARLRTPK